MANKKGFRVIPLYAPQLVPIIPEVFDKSDEETWRSVLDAVYDKHRIAKDIRMSISATPAKDFVKKLASFLRASDGGAIRYAFGELGRLRERVKEKHRAQSVDLESILLDSVKRRRGDFPEAELSTMHNILFKSFSNGRDIYVSAPNVFDDFADKMLEIPHELRPAVLSQAEFLLDKSFGDEGSKHDILYKKGIALVSYANAARERAELLGTNFAKWANGAIKSHGTLNGLIAYLDDRHSYFTDDLEEAAGGLSLGKVHGRLVAYVRALTGKPIKIEKASSPDLSCSFSGDTFRLPPAISTGETDEGRFSVYKALASYQSAALVFGTYDLDASQVSSKTRALFGKEGKISDFFKAFDNPDFAHRLFELLEIARLDARLSEKFPGLVKDLSAFKSQVVSSSDRPQDSAPLLEGIRDCAYGLRTRKNTNLDSIVSPEVERLRMADSRVERTVEAVHRVYNELSKIFDIPKEEQIPAMLSIDTAVMEEDPEEREASYRVAGPEDKLTAGKKFRYDEWDENKGAYLPSFVQVVEAPYPGQSVNDYVKGVLERDHVVIGRLKRIFEALKPEAFERVRRQISGDVDYEELVKAKAEIASGITPSEKVYTREYKNQRSVASVVLSDCSGSLRKFLDPRNPDQRIIDVIRQTQIYFAEALEAIGDRYALATFSGETEKNVEFYMIKDFSQPYNGEVRNTIGALRPLKQNRDGAGIRHATQLLRAQPEKIKLLFYLMEGLPHDFGYEKAYAVADVTRAIIEAKREGCLPVIIASGREITDEVRSISNHCIYREASDPRVVPELLPDLYRRMTA